MKTRALNKNIGYGVALAAVLIFVFATRSVFFTAAQQDSRNTVIKTTDLGGDIYLLEGRGGNIAVSVGEDGVFVVDDQFAPLSEKIMAEIARLSDRPVSYVLNTHWHEDHTGGNENFGKSGAVIVAHENVRKRMSTKQFIAALRSEVPAAPLAALPVVTFSDGLNFHFNGNNIVVQNVPSSHTDGDSIVFFSESNVLHMGDTFLNGFFPFIDQSSGGTLDGLINAIETAIDMADDDTDVIPGHGSLSDIGGLTSYHAMLIQVRDLMQPLLDSGKSRSDVLAANPLGEVGKIWGNGFITTDLFTGILFDLAAQQ